jgi:radical SAM superfamily enzyme YgiQ (UPF0313 family)
MSEKVKVIIACKPCGHVEVVCGMEAEKNEILDWLERGLTVRAIPLEEFQATHAATMLCDCKEAVPA